jgi:hypothetical protein
VFSAFLVVHSLVVSANTSRDSVLSRHASRVEAAAGRQKALYDVTNLNGGRTHGHEKTSALWLVPKKLQYVAGSKTRRG